MKLKYFYIIAIYFTFLNNTYSNDYFNLNKGDTIIPYDKGNYSLRAYFFVRPGSCDCLKFLSTIDNEITNSNTELICFVSCANDKVAEDFKKSYKISFDVIADKINSYQEYYKAKRINVVLVSDVKGKVLYYDELSLESIDKIKELAKSNLNTNISNDYSQYEIVNSLIVDYTDKPYYTNMEYLNFFKTSIKDIPFAFIKDDKLYIINKEGKIKDAITLDYTNDDKYNYFLPALSINSDSAIFMNAFAYANTSVGLKRRLLVFDIDKNKISNYIDYADDKDSIILKSNVITPINNYQGYLCVNS